MQVNLATGCRVESGAATLAAEPERASALRRSGPCGGEDRIIGSRGLADFLDALEVRCDTLRGDELAVLVLAAHVETAKLAPLFVDARVHVAPTQVPGLDRAHTRVGHDKDEVVDDGAVPYREIESLRARQW